jgi:hypothetical protein
MADRAPEDEEGAAPRARRTWQFAEKELADEFRTRATGCNVLALGYRGDGEAAVEVSAPLGQGRLAKVFAIERSVWADPDRREFVERMMARFIGSFGYCGAGECASQEWLRRDEAAG